MQLLKGCFTINVNCSLQTVHTSIRPYKSHEYIFMLMQSDYIIGSVLTIYCFTNSAAGFVISTTAGRVYITSV